MTEELHKSWNEQMLYEYMGFTYMHGPLYDCSEKVSKMDGFKENNLWLTENGNIVYGTKKELYKINRHGEIKRHNTMNLNILYIDQFDNIDTKVIYDECEANVDQSEDKYISNNISEDRYLTKKVLRKDFNKTTSAIVYNKTRKGKRELKRKSKAIVQSKTIKAQRKIKNIHGTIGYYDKWYYDKCTTTAICIGPKFVSEDAYNILTSDFYELEYYWGRYQHYDWLNWHVCQLKN